MKAVSLGEAGPGALAPYARLNPALSKAVSTSFPALAKVPNIGNIPGVADLVSGLTGAVGEAIDSALGDVGEAIDDAIGSASDAVEGAIDEWLS